MDTDSRRRAGKARRDAREGYGAPRLGGHDAYDGRARGDALTTYGGVHELVVEHEDLGIIDDEQEVTSHPTTVSEVYGFEVRYIVRHPDDCWPENKTPGRPCPITQQVEDVGLDSALGLLHWRNGRDVLEHLEDGLYKVRAWAQHYSSPNGDDWDGGLEIEKQETPPAPPRPPMKFELVEPKESDA